jgi:hypothetical protein
MVKQLLLRRMFQPQLQITIILILTERIIVLRQHTTAQNQ